MLGGLASCFWSFVDRYHCLSVHLSAKTQSLFLDAWKDPKRIVPRIHLIGPYLHWPTAAVEIYTSHLNFLWPIIFLDIWNGRIAFVFLSTSYIFFKLWRLQRMDYSCMWPNHTKIPNFFNNRKEGSTWK